MTKKNEEILEKKFHDAFENHFDEIDYYKDMNYKTNFDIGELMNSKKKSRPPKFRGLKVASLIFAFLICSSAFAMAITNGSVEAGKNKILDFFYSLTGEDHRISDNEESFQIYILDDKENIEKAKDLIPQLFIENEIFDGYVFDQMEVDKINNNSISAYSTYTKGDQIISINQSVINEDARYNMEPFDQEKKVSGGVMYSILDYNDEKGSNCVFYLKDGNTVEVIGYIDIEVLEKFVEKKIIKKY